MSIDVTFPATQATVGDGHNNGYGNHGGWGRGDHHHWHGQTDQQVMGVGFSAAALAASKTDERICDASAAAALAACKTSDEVAAVYASLQKQASDGFTAVVAYAKDAQATAYQIEGRGALEAAKNAAAIGLQATTNANLLSVEAAKNFYALSLENTKNAAASALQVSMATAELKAQAAECCCELKELITAQGNTTRDLINSNTIQGLRDQLVATQRLIAVTIPVGA